MHIDLRNTDPCFIECGRREKTSLIIGGTRVELANFFGEPAGDDETTADLPRLKATERTFVELRSGMTYYELYGSSGDPLVVLVHGLTTPMFVWDYQLKSLVRSGFQVLRYDLYGRGFSDRPLTKYNSDLFNNQLMDLLSAVGNHEPYALVGLSLGGAISVNFAALETDRIQKLFLIAPAGLREKMPWWFYLGVKLGLVDFFQYTVGNWFLKTIGPKNLTDDSAKQSIARRKIEQQLEFEGYHRSLASTLRYGPVYGIRDSYRTVGESDLPVHALWSREDTVVPSQLHRELRQVIPQVDVTLVDEGTHTVNYDRPELVNPPLLDFLGEQGGTAGSQPFPSGE